MPKFICDRLSYSECARLYAGARDKEKGKPIAKNAAYYIQQGYDTHPVTGKNEECYWLKMYSTNILVYFADGAVRINDYVSVTTTCVLNELGPVSIGSNSKCGFVNTRRFGSRSFGYPMPDQLNISAEGVVQDKLVDYTRRIRPECKAERRAIAKEFREAAMARLVLGEFPQLIEADEVSEGRELLRVFRVNVPYDANRLFHALLYKQDHGEVAAVCARGTNRLKKQYGLRAGGSSYHQGYYFMNQVDAAKALCACLLESEMSDARWYVDTPTEYENVRVPISL